MPGQFYIVGMLKPSNTGHSYRVYALSDNGEKIFIGYVSLKAVRALLNKEITQADICKFSQTGQEEPLNFNLELKP